jgi:hypothetical protein
MTEGPRDYDREFTTPLEYRFNGGWREIVRFDHDVTEEGVHMDAYRDGEKLRSEGVFPPMPASDALTFAEGHSNQHAERYIDRFEE